MMDTIATNVSQPIGPLALNPITTDSFLTETVGIDLTNQSKLKKLCELLAVCLDVSIEDLFEWINSQHGIPIPVIMQVLQLAKRYRLNPLWGEVTWEKAQDDLWQVYLPIDSWITLLHRQKPFKGLSFSESNTLIDGVPEWMECAIWRSDHRQPITVKEYFIEVRTDHPIWQTMPRRMLRHKVLQQALRLVFGISVPEFTHQEIMATTILTPTEIRVDQAAQPSFVDRRAALKEKLRELSSK
jgi:hypothetical protein